VTKIGRGGKGHVRLLGEIDGTERRMEGENGWIGWIGWKGGERKYWR